MLFFVMFQCNSLQRLYYEYISAKVADDLSYCFCPCLFTFLFFCVLFILIGYNYLFFVVSGCLAVTTAMLEVYKLIAQMMTMVERFPVCFWKFNLLLPVQILIPNPAFASSWTKILTSYFSIFFWSAHEVSHLKNLHHYLHNLSYAEPLCLPTCILLYMYNDYKGLFYSIVPS